MKPLESTLTQASLAVAALALASCARGCDESSGELKGPPPAAASAAVVRTQTRAQSVRTPRLDGAKTTREILDALAKDCLSCAEKNGCLDVAQQGGVCEGVPGTSKVSGETETALCLDALRCIFTTKCANSGEETPCLCGPMDAVECIEGRSPPKGACVEAFKKDFGDEGKKMYDNFIKPEYGAGQANALVQCVLNLCPTCRIR